MTKTAVFHIGPARTGSTAIQHFLSRNREQLSQDGVRASPAGKKHVRDFIFATGSWSDVSESRFVPLLDITEEKFERRAETARDRLRRQLENDEHRTAVFSREGLFHASVDRIERLKAFFAPFYDAFRIVCVLRRQDCLALSRYKNRVKKVGAMGGPFDEDVKPYDDGLDRWASVFGRESLHPLLYPEWERDDSALIVAFLGAAALPTDVASMTPPGRPNPSWDARAIEIMKLANKHIPALADGTIPPERQVLEKILPDVFPEKIRYLPARADALNYAERYRATNERVRAAWFPERSSLFSEDFSMYPETSPDERLSLDDCGWVIAQMAKRIGGRRREKG